MARQLVIAHCIVTSLFICVDTAGAGETQCAGAKDGADGADGCPSGTRNAFKATKLGSLDAEMQNINIDLLDWMRSQGAFVNECIEAQSCPPFGGRCISSRCNLEPGDRLMSVPPHLQLSPYGNVSASPCPMLAEMLANETEWNVKEDEVLLVLRLMEERSAGNASNFMRYFKTLPHEYPRILSDVYEQTQCLAGLPGLSNVERRFIREGVKVGILQSCPSAADEATTRWAKLTINTRAFSGTLPGISRGKKPVEWSRLVPFADMFNDGLDPSATWTLDSQTGNFEVNATRSISAGTEILISYGAKANENIMTKYGFVHSNNPNDKATIYLKDGSALAGPPPSLTLSLGLESAPQLTSALKRPLRTLRAEIMTDVQNDQRQTEIGILSELKRRCNTTGLAWASASGDIREESRWMCDGYRASLVGLSGACCSFADMAIAELEGMHHNESSTTAVDRLANRLLKTWREMFTSL